MEANRSKLSRLNWHGRVRSALEMTTRAASSSRRRARHLRMRVYHVGEGRRDRNLGGRGALACGRAPCRSHCPRRGCSGGTPCRGTCNAPADDSACHCVHAGARHQGRHRRDERGSAPQARSPSRGFDQGRNGVANFALAATTVSVSVRMNATSAALSAPVSGSRCGAPPGPRRRLSSAGPFWMPLA